MKVEVALIGNPNCGKTTLFNSLTGSFQKTGNWSGVTVEKKEGFYVKDKKVKIIDLPGVYSLSANSIDERVVLDYIKKTPPKVIINVVDGTNLERNLYLTTELAEMGIPMVIAINMYDELKKNQIKLNQVELENTFNLPVVPVSALKNYNIDKLIGVALTTDKRPFFSIVKNASAETIAEERYKYIDKHIKNIITKKTTLQERFTEKADRFLLNKYLGIPIFFLIITAIYFLSIKIGGFFGEYITLFFERLAINTKNSFNKVGAPDWIGELFCGAVIKGVGTVTSFLPQILVLFTLLTIMEQCGYSARTAFLLDSIFKNFGLSGKSIIPLSLSCGCTVSGLMATRTIDGEGERKMTLFLSPFMPCGAKTAVFGWFSHVFFNGNALIASLMYFISILSVGLFGALLKKLKPFKANYDAFILEIPMLRRPVFKDLYKVLWEKFKDFTAKAGSIIFIVSIILWALSNFGFNGYTNGKIEDSLLYLLGNVIKYLFYPLGFGNWQTSVAVLSSFFAKEAVIETLQIVCLDVGSIFYNRWSVFAFMTFVLLSPPCMASIVTAYKELKSKKWLLFMILFQTISAYIISLSINVIGIIINLSSGLLLSLIIVIIILLTFCFAIKRLSKKGCSSCKRCKKGASACLKSSKHNMTI